MAITDRIRSAWNTFRNRPIQEDLRPLGPSSWHNPDRPRFNTVGDRTTLASIYNKMSIDFADVAYRHIDTDDQGRFKNIRPSALNYALTLEPNIDQGPQALRQDIALTMMEHGVAVVVPVDTSADPSDAASFDIYTLRVGYPVGWFENHIRVSLFNQERQERQEIIVDKAKCAVIQNPHYAIMNAPNSTMARLQQKLALLDQADHRTGSGKLDIIVQLPYTVRTDARREEVTRRLNDIEMQLQGSSYGIAYADATEKITQLNRPAENTLLKQVEYLTAQLYTQLGLTPEIVNGTASSEAMLNYYSRTIEPMVVATAEAMQRSFIGRNRTTRGERIDYFRDPFKLVPIAFLAELVDTLARNEVLSSNEIRGLLGFRPSDDPKADELRNSNMPDGGSGAAPESGGGGVPVEKAPGGLQEVAVQPG